MTPDQDVLTAEQVIEWLQLGAEGGNPQERLRNLCRRQRLPFVRRGRLLRFLRPDVAKWLAEDPLSVRKIKHPARLQGSK